jgi:hypothetical protein
MSQQPLEPDLNRLAHRLSGLSPSSGGLNRDRMLFQAGRAVADRASRSWRTAALLLTGFSFYLGFRLIQAPTEPEQIIVERVVYVPTPAAPSPDGPSLSVAASSARPTPVAVPSVEPALSAVFTLVVPPHQESPAERYQRLQDNLARWGLDGVGVAPPVTPASRPVEVWLGVPVEASRPEAPSGWDFLFY